MKKKQLNAESGGSGRHKTTLTPQMQEYLRDVVEVLRGEEPGNIEREAELVDRYDELDKALKSEEPGNVEREVDLYDELDKALKSTELEFGGDSEEERRREREIEESSSPVIVIDTDSEHEQPSGMSGRSRRKRKRTNTSETVPNNESLPKRRRLEQPSGRKRKRENTSESVPNCRSLPKRRRVEHVDLTEPVRVEQVDLTEPDEYDSVHMDLTEEAFAVWEDPTALPRPERDPANPANCRYMTLVWQLRVRFPRQFAQKSTKAWYSAVWRWCDGNDIKEYYFTLTGTTFPDSCRVVPSSLRTINRKSYPPKSKAKMATELRQLRVEVQRLVEEEGISHENICNMDETSMHIFLTMVKTLHWKAAKRVLGDNASKLAIEGDQY